jgi:hypothetical protein
MNNNSYLKNSTTNSLVYTPILFTIMLGEINYQEDFISAKQIKEIDNRVVFDQLPNQNITFEQSQMDILVSFVSKLVNESKDLDGEIVDMVNRNFEELLLKL